MKIKSILTAVSLFIAGVFVFVAVSAHEGAPSTKEILVTGETHHLEVKPASLEGYRIPNMEVTVKIIDDLTHSEKIVTLHPMFGGNFHYGANVTLEPKKYRLVFHLDPPTFMREGKRMGQWLSAAEAEFPFDGAMKFDDNVKIGEKETADMKISFETEHAEEMLAFSGGEVVPMVHDEKKEDGVGIAHQLEEFLPFEHFRDNHLFAAILSSLLWASLIYVAYSLVKKFNKTQ